MKPERPEPEEHWQNRQADELHNQELNAGGSLLFSERELRFAYNAGEANIDCDGCHIDPPDSDFKDVIEDIIMNRKKSNRSKNE